MTKDPMNGNVNVPNLTTALPSVLWSGWAASVTIVALSIIAVEGMPHTRGIAFYATLRYAIVAPLCIVATIAAALLYRYLVTRSERPRTGLSLTLCAFAIVGLLTVFTFGSHGLALAAAPTFLVVPIAIAILVPRYVERPRRSRAGTIAIVLLGVLEIVGVGAALLSERPAPLSAQGFAFDVPRTAFDVDHKFIDLPSGAHIHYVDEGQGPVILFLHGNPSWSFQWRDLIHGLRGSYRCIALDYPGFGLSNAAAGFDFTPREESLVVEEFVKQLGLHDITLVMQDWGGPIGLGFAERNPSLVRGVVLGSTWAWPTDTSVARGKFSFIAGGPIGEFIQMNFNGFAKFGVAQGVTHKLPNDIFDIYTRPSRPVERRGVEAFYPGQINAATDYFNQINARLPLLAEKKALIFWALKDEGFTLDDLARFQQAFPNNKTIKFPFANHFFFEDEADKMLPEIRTFMSTEQILKQK
jgi:pimeloyl-ACP methyl ester carboxylesterase